MSVDPAKSTTLQGAEASEPGGIGFFEKWLSIWVALCILAGIGLGNGVPGLFRVLAPLQ